jgi:hypothetical protein
VANLLPPHSPRSFAERFEASFAALQVRIEESCLAATPWRERAGAAIGTAFRFAAEDPAAAADLTTGLSGHGVEGQARHDRLVAYIAGLLLQGRAERAENAELPDHTEVGLAGGILLIVARYVERGRTGSLPGAIPDAAQFVLAPYLGTAEAAAIAASLTQNGQHCL